jgi:TonB family protein
MKTLIIFVSLIFAFCNAFAQQDSVAYLLKNSGERVSSRDSADFVLVLKPEDASRVLFTVRGYYPTGKLMLSATSRTQTLPLTLQGDYTDYFPNGNKMKVRTFTDGQQTGSITEYYPNGKFYNKKKIKELEDQSKALSFEECSDSTGKVLTKNGNGYWITYNRRFTAVTEQGKVVNGFRDSIWTIMGANNQKHTQQYFGGTVIARYRPPQAPQRSDESVDTRPPGSPDTVVGAKTYVPVQIVPDYPGGMDAFFKFLSRNIRYPNAARDNNITGRVIVSFTVEKDGTLTDIRVTREIGGGCDEEALRVMKLSPKWKPGMVNGVAVRVAYSVPINFAGYN